jgi:hypothetical protein
MQEHFQKTESVPKDFVTVEGVTSEAVPKLCPSLAILANLSVLAPRRINKMSVINTGGECNSLSAPSFQRVSAHWIRCVALALHGWALSESSALVCDSPTVLT